MAPATRLIAAGAAAFVAGLIVTFPAHVAYHQFAPPGLALSGISGSIWNGAAARGDAFGLYLGDVRWQFRPLSLLTFNARYSLEGTPPGGFIECDVLLRPGGTLTVRNLAAAMPLAALQSLLPPSGVEGDVSLRFDKLVLNDGMPIAAEGTAGLSQLLLGDLLPVPLGDYRVVLETADERITGHVEDVAGVLEVRGTLTIERSRAYSLIGEVAARDDAPDSLVRQLNFLGSPNERGRREFRFEGQL